MLLARDYNPSIKIGGAKWLPNDIAGMLGLPTIGNIYYVDPYAGSDTANNGGSPNTALATVTAAYALCTSGNHDVVIISPTGGTGRTVEPATITWAKRFTHLIGSAAPIHSTPRAGMSWATTDTLCMTVSENGCIFKNIVIAANSATTVGCVKVTGDYNYFEGVHFLGMNNATTAAAATGYCLKLTSAEENLFVGCTLGGIQYARSDANSNLVVETNASMNRFVDCDFNVQATNAGVIWVTADDGAGTAIQGFLDFIGCRFINYTTTAMTIGMNTSASGGIIRMLDSSWYGATDLADFYAAVWSNRVAATQANSGILVQVTT